MLGKHGLFNLDWREAPLLQGGYLKSFFKRNQKKVDIFNGIIKNQEKEIEFNHFSTHDVAIFNMKVIP